MNMITRTVKVNVEMILDKLYTDYVHKLQAIYENEYNSTYENEYNNVAYCLSILYEIKIINSTEFNDLITYSQELLNVYKNTENIERKEVKA